jgi:hypothetical protein
MSWLPEGAHPSGTPAIRHRCARAEPGTSDYCLADRRGSDFAAGYDSLAVMEQVMRHFYLRALIEEGMGAEADSGPGRPRPVVALPSHSRGSRRPSLRKLRAVPFAPGSGKARPYTRQGWRL